MSTSAPRIPVSMVTTVDAQSDGLDRFKDAWARWEPDYFLSVYDAE